jgi:hypothetical protein
MNDMMGMEWNGNKYGKLRENEKRKREFFLGVDSIHSILFYFIFQN